ncbi:MAG: hypothetical protein WCE21_00205 [Candidatus Babeliales bacterium]
MSYTATALFSLCIIAYPIVAMEPHKQCAFPLSDKIINAERADADALEKPIILWQRKTHDIAAFHNAIDVTTTPEEYFLITSTLAKMTLYVATSMHFDDESMINTFKVKRKEHATLFGDAHYPTSLYVRTNGKTKIWASSALYWFLTHSIHILDGTDAAKKKEVTPHTLFCIERFLTIDLSNAQVIKACETKTPNKQFDAKEKLHAIHYGLIDTIDIVHYSKGVKQEKIKPTTQSAKHFYASFATIYPDIDTIRLYHNIQLTNGIDKRPQIAKHVVTIAQQGIKRKQDEISE